MFLKFISNLSEKFRNIISENQKLPSKKSKTFLKNSKREKKVNDREWVLILRPLVWQSNALTTVWYGTCFKWGKKIISVFVWQRFVWLRWKFFENLPGECLKVDIRSEFFRDYEKLVLIKWDTEIICNWTIQTFILLIKEIITREVNLWFYSHYIVKLEAVFFFFWLLRKCILQY